MLSSLFVMQKCSVEVARVDVDFLALMPEKDMSLINILDAVDGYPICDALSDEVFSNFDPDSAYALRDYFPRLKRVVLIAENDFSVCILEGEIPEADLTENEIIKPEEDIVLLSSIADRSEILLQ